MNIKRKEPDMATTEKKALIILIVDHDTYESECPDEKVTLDMLHTQGKHVNEDAAGMFGYEGWITVLDAPPELMEAISANADPTVAI